MAETAKWYVICTNTGYEAMVKNTLEKMIENSGLQDQILDIYIPMEETIEEKANGKKKVVMKKVVPCYIFIKLVYSNQLWYLITNTRGVRGFVGPQGKAVPLTSEEVRRMGLERTLNVSDIDFEVGSSVKIISGALNGFTGVVLDLNKASQKAKVKVLMFDTETEVEVDFVGLKKAD